MRQENPQELIRKQRMSGICKRQSDATRDVVVTKKVWDRIQKNSQFKLASNSF